MSSHSNQTKKTNHDHHSNNANNNRNNKALFPLGRALATPGAIALLKSLHTSPSELLKRHVTGDWKEMEQEDQESNEQALIYDNRVFSAYTLQANKFWVITEVDRSSTTVLLPEEY